MTTHSDVLDLAAFRRVMEMHYINANTYEKNITHLFGSRLQNLIKETEEPT